jgi:hypothetical protein
MSLKTLLATAGAALWLAFDAASGLPVTATISVGSVFTVLYAESLVIENISRIRS